MSEGAGAQGPRAPSAGAAWGLAGPPGRPGQVVKTSPSQASKQLPHSHRRSCRSPAKSCPRSLTSITDADAPCTLIFSRDVGQACGCCVPLHVVRRTREKLGPLAQHPLLVLSARSLLLQALGAAQAVGSGRRDEGTSQQTPAVLAVQQPAVQGGAAVPSIGPGAAAPLHVPAHTLGSPTGPCSQSVGTLLPGWGCARAIRDPSERTAAAERFLIPKPVTERPKQQASAEFTDRPQC